MTFNVSTDGKAKFQLHNGLLTARYEGHPEQSQVDGGHCLWMRFEKLNFTKVTLPC